MEDNVLISPSDWVSSDEIIKVLGVGGGGCNAVNYMYNQGIEGCSFVVCNTDSQALQGCSVPVKIQLGPGLGAGTNPIEGRNYALESQDEVKRIVLDTNTKMLFITAGMGGGTGTGAAPVIAKMAKDMGILTVAVVTLPFSTEGNEALTRAIDGIHELEKNVDSLLLINNDKLHDYFGGELLHLAFPRADEVLLTAVKGIIEIIKKRGYINVDFKDVVTMMKNSGMALMGSGSGSGENRIDDAVKAAFESPLLNDFDLKTAKKVLINITCGKNDQGLTMDDLRIITDKIAEYTGNTNNFKRGLIWDDDPNIGDTIKITSIVTGLKFNEVLGPSDKIGNYIFIDKNYVYDKSVKDSDGISLTEDYKPINHGSGSRDNVRAFNFDLDRRPTLLCEEDNLAYIINTTAYNRKGKKKNKSIWQEQE